MKIKIEGVTFRVEWEHRNPQPRNCKQCGSFHEAKNRKTMCTIVNDKTGEVYAEGMARTKDGENYIKDIGRRISLLNALENKQFDQVRSVGEPRNKLAERAFRKNIMHQYDDRRNEVPEFRVRNGDTEITTAHRRNLWLLAHDLPVPQNKNGDNCYCLMPEGNHTPDCNDEETPVQDVTTAQAELSAK